MRESHRILREKGYQVFLEFKLPNNKVADVYGKGNEENVIIECLVKPHLSILEQKRKNYDFASTKLIIAYPKSFVPTVNVEDYCDEVLTIDVPEIYLEKQKSFPVRNETWQKLMTLKSELLAPSMDGVISYLLLLNNTITREGKNER